MFTARLDGAGGAQLLGNVDLYGQIAAVLDASTVVVRGDGRWERRDLRGEAVAPYVASSGGTAEKFGFALSPSGRLALDFDHQGFAVLDANAPAAPPVLARREYPAGVSMRPPASGRPAWSADDRRVAFGDGYDIAVVDIASGDERVFALDALGAGLLRDEHADRLWALTWTPDHTLRFATQRGLWQLDVDAGTAVKVAEPPRPGGFTQGTVFAYSPDGRTLAAATQFGLFVLDGANWRQLSSVGVPIGHEAIYWAPDSSAVVYAGEMANVPEGVIVAPVDGSGAYRLVAPLAGRLLGWLPDGRIVWVSTTGGI